METRSARAVAIDSFRKVSANPNAIAGQRNLLLDAFSVASDEMIRRDFYHTEAGLRIMERLFDLQTFAMQGGDVVRIRNQALEILQS